MEKLESPQAFLFEGNVSHTWKPHGSNTLIFIWLQQKKIPGVIK